MIPLVYSAGYSRVVFIPFPSPLCGIGHGEWNQRILISEFLLYLRPPHKGAAIRLDKLLHKFPSKDPISL